MEPSVTAQAGGALEEEGAHAEVAEALAAAEEGARAALADQGVAQAELSLTLLDDAAMAELNERWLGHEGPTDAISFPLYEEGETPTGDVYLGLDAARRQAAEAGCGLREEILRLAVHGTLHVLGWDHPEGEARVTSPMWAAQERIVRTAVGA